MKQILQEWSISPSTSSQKESIRAAQAPFPKDSGFCWWKMPPGVRSSTATVYEGYDTSQKLALDAWKEETPDLVVGHSQGAILLAALLANQAIAHHPRVGYIFNGVAWPNPYTQKLESLSSTSLERVRILLIVGQQDRINPPEQALRLQDALTQAGADVQRLDHPGGHAIPTEEDVVAKVRSWISRG